ncbi:F-box/WD repeat-containing protein 9-like [Adelges cooleyi]|uniref:F-box/WD repeat-containing protein 9-like n=1 Tax=Adelges cooleyi TaxID=133065 RepID=UPI00217F2ECB|nr:F-box/WD repeat-containing protein 9-like [Adelges cooleyi]
MNTPDDITDVHDGVMVPRVSLDSIPIEVFLMICERLDADTLLRSLMYVCKKLNGIISDNYLWKKRALEKFNNCDVAFTLTNDFKEETFNWKQFAWHTELEENCWSDYQINTDNLIFNGTHYSEVDAVMMTKSGDHCISASRDRSICFWNTTGIDTNPVAHKADSHTGWVWGLNMYDANHFLSCSWDSSVKLWNMDNFSQDVEPIHKFTTDAAVLTVTCKENFIAAGLYTPKVVAFDPRDSEKHLFELNPHTRSIIELCLIQDYYLISLSEDRTISLWDLRSQKTVKSMYLAEKSSRFPMCASYYDNVLFIGDSRDHMYWLDCSDGAFDVLKTVNFVRPLNTSRKRYKINCIKCTNYGSIIIGGNEGAVYFITPTSPLRVITKIDSGSEITSIDYQNNTLVVGYVDSSVRVWKKK